MRGELLSGVRERWRGRNQTGLLLSQEVGAVVLKARSQVGHTPHHLGSCWKRQTVRPQPDLLNEMPGLSSACSPLESGNNHRGRKCPQKRSKMNGPGSPQSGIRLCSPNSKLYHPSLSTRPPPHSLRRNVPPGPILTGLGQWACEQM